MQDCNRSSEAEAEPLPNGPIGDGRAIEAMKNAVAVGRRYARATVGDFQAGAATFCSNGKLHSAARRSELDRVVDEIRNSFAQ
jgi:hypothetical protein